ncbi:SCO1860 family LAETG-anchored protein [Streptomyces sp. DH37]|uniref:SCO1860 family LAETG-anchored protein n=1 Tax=Streptomyces sp. DH37 TaxID=3040122 RepID=UPI002441840B|nr:SCO1860 family LAETG-anchored protein [Streptomyces sp. DH37]MDG9703651.1 SCO1860 family LAETG-anchored protein [Streptomyces sp. DH37]
MNKSVYGLLAAAALVGATAAPADAAGDEGSASAAVLRANLDVSLLEGGAGVPVNAELNAVRAPEDTEKAAATVRVRVEGAERGRPIALLRADAATARATAGEDRAEGYSNLLRARVHVPGLPLLSLIKVDAVTSRAVCEAGARPVAESEIPGTVTVLGKRVAVKADGTTSVRVEGVGTVELKLAEAVTTSRTAAATALRLDVAVDPADLGVAGVEGRVTLVEAACETPGGEGGGSTGGNGGSTGSTGGDGGSSGSTGGDGGSSGSSGSAGSTGGNGGSSGSSGAASGGSTEGSTGGDGSSTGSAGSTGSTGSAGSTDGKGNEPRPQTGSEPSGEKPTGSLAETGGSSATPYIAGGALALVAAGGALVMLRRRRASGAADA